MHRIEKTGPWSATTFHSLEALVRRHRDPDDEFTTAFRPRAKRRVLPEQCEPKRADNSMALHNRGSGKTLAHSENGSL
jgi:hypothetical protein